MFLGFKRVKFYMWQYFQALDYLEHEQDGSFIETFCIADVENRKHDFGPLVL